eukprot:CAMPEP_0182448172 /NCGR_PEP_ID=MMETSP1172-20130603/24458_1 /TAXON_ID=708627 /ORGANISM="Timspurckia oligopyrenoides, Strain CCMP3278" /LENGTH=69 /DNA_ID=CAMNT_0024644937 /DNA_START=693 /DNA_END=902 /DNA_ORIENTATION=+
MAGVNHLEGYPDEVYCWMFADPNEDYNIRLEKISPEKVRKHRKQNGSLNAPKSEKKRGLLSKLKRVLFA